MKRDLTRIMKFISLSVVIIIFLLITTNVYAANVTRANSATSFSGSTLNTVLHGDSYISGYGAFAKITLYLATTNDKTKGVVYKNIDGKKYIDMENTPTTRLDGEPMFVKFGQSIITKNDMPIPKAAYVNLATSKLDSLIDFKKGEKRYPVFNTKLTDAQLSNVGVPRWIVYINGVATNNHTNVVNYFKGNGNAVMASENLRKIIFEVAEKSDISSATDYTAVNNILYQTRQKASFQYIDKSGERTEISVKHILPTSDDYLANWLVVYEPVLNYYQDPQKMFFPTKGGASFLITATDAVLQNLHSGAEGYPSIVKFLSGAPKVVMHYNHCRLCDLTWYGYPEWPHSDLPLAAYCPLPCPGLSSDYDGVKTKDRYPFSIPSAVKAAAKNFTIEYNWLRYSGGYLFDKPTESMDVLVEGTNTDNIIHYGGYSLFVNGPAKAEDSTKIPVYLKVVVLNKDYSFTTVPFVKMNLTTKNNMTSSQQAEADEAAMTFIQKHKGVETTLTEKYNRIKNGTFKYNAETDSGYTPIAFIEEEVDYSDLLKNIKIYPQEIEGLSKSVQMKNFNLSSYESNIIQSNPNYPVIDLTTNINNYLDVLKEAADSANYIGYDGTITLKDGTKIGPNEEIQPNWDRFIVHASNEGIDSLNDIKSVFNIMFYDKENPAENIPMAFTYKGDPIYITIILSIVKSPPPPVDVPIGNIIQEDMLMKAMSYSKDSDSEGLISKVIVKKNVYDTTCDGYDTVSCKHPDPEDPTKKLHSYDTVGCGHSKTLSNAKDITPKTITVQPSWYWNASMFNNVSKLSALRNSGALVDDGVTFVFNTTSSFTSNNMSDAFDQIAGYRFVAHRNADPDNNGAVKPLQLAAYMNGTPQNSAYLNFMSKYYGTYPSAYSNQAGSFEANNFRLETAMDLPQNVTAVGYGRFCSGGSRNDLNIPVKLLGEIKYGATTEESTQFKTSSEIKIQATIKSHSKSANPFTTTKQYFGIDPNGAANPMYLIQVQSDTIKFNPAFKMKYQDSNNPDAPFKEVWILAAGEKTFISNDYVKIEVTQTNLKVTSPWSRDSEDKVDENGNIRTIPTAKAGNTIKASANGAKIQVDVYYHIQDPNFVEPSQRAAVQARNDAKARQFDDMVTSIANAFRNNGVSFYSNMYQSTTSGTLNKVAAPNYFKDLTSKTELKLASSVTTTINSQVRAYYLDVNGIADYTTASRTININGQTVPAKDKWTDISAVRSENVLRGILEQNGGVLVPGWYNEDYEGIIVVHKTYVITLNNLETTYAQIHPQHSDSQTARNELAQQLKFVQGTEILIPDNQYGIGVEYRLPALTINGQTFSNIVIPSKPFLFDIRGSVYDTK